MALAVLFGACSVPHQKHPDGGPGMDVVSGDRPEPPVDATVDLARDQATGDADVPGSDDGGAGDETDVVPPASVAAGNACGVNTDCASGVCSDGVCCEGPCSGLCMACSTAYTNQKSGECHPVTAGRDPRGACQDESAQLPCGQDGTCDGAGACRKPGPEHVCAPAACVAAGNMFMAASTCDRAGNCVAGAATACGENPCATTGCAKPCTQDDACPGGYCAGGTCKTKKINGDACAGTNQCKSGVCSSEKVCCEKDCTQACMACTEALTGQKNGTCAFVQAGLDPGDACVADPARACGHDGTCDGKGACAFYGSNQECRDPACSGTTFTAAGTCDGKGTCAPGTPVDCSPTTCAPDGCKMSCASEADCKSGFYCAPGTPGTCVPKKHLGEKCNPSECAAGACVDGVCCESACQDKCYACARALTDQPDGQCRPVQPNKTPAGECALEEQMTCGQDGACDGHGQCRQWSGNTCAAASCAAGNQYVGAPTCDGNGRCVSPAAQPCGATRCDPTTACNGDCENNTSCLGNTYCDLGTKKCVPQKNQGTACQDSTECLQQHCVDQVCCESECTGTCYACARAATGQSDGLCQPVTAPIPEPACASVPGNVCGPTGMCNGGGACAYPRQETQCKPGRCTGTQSVGPAICDGRGGCVAPDPQECAPAMCSVASGCNNPCTLDSDCAGNGYCDSNHKCQHQKTLGGDCSRNGECDTTFCADGVCCNEACDKPCEACNRVVPHTGLCMPISGPPNRGSCPGATSGVDAACASRCANVPDGSCSPYPGQETQCVPAACSGPQFIVATTCNGQGKCSAQQSAMSCPGGYHCSGNACSTTCGSDAECDADYFCSENKCHLRATAIAVGGGHTCVIVKDGTVRCWGYNGFGQVGGSGSPIPTPVQVPGVTSVQQIAAGQVHTCARLAAGTVKCWGDNDSGQVGDGTMTSKLTVVDVVGLGGTVKSIGLGRDTSCAVLADDTGRCWGDGSAGSLGDGTMMNSGQPKTVVGLTGAAVIAPGNEHACALLKNGTLSCWGQNNAGQLGTGAMDPPAPQKAVAATAVGASLIGSSVGTAFSCAISGTAAAGGPIKCWGSGGIGSLGNGTGLNTTALVPVTVTDITNAIAVTTDGFYSACALLKDGTVKCWGSGQYGKLGDGTQTDHSTPVIVNGVTGVVGVGVGYDHGCALLDSGRVKCWGLNSSGAIGNGTAVQGQILTPTSVLGW